jgi:isopentenyl-diphosphate delta-isomerase
MMDNVILVDEQDNVTGTMEKIRAHREGVLHRAFSILLFNDRGEILLQKRAQGKYHSAGLWTNTCCSHPLPNESMEHATRRKLLQEMGIDMQPEFAYKFIYKVALDNSLTEHELDHVFIGQYNGNPDINPEEVADWKYISMTDLRKDINLHPERYTYWFRLILNHPEFSPLPA